jgi:hypothetical protein
MAGNLQQAERRADFFENAALPEVGCTHARLAFVLAETEGLFDTRGAPNREAIMTAAPEVFRKAGMQGSADGGAGGAEAPNENKSVIGRRAHPRNRALPASRRRAALTCAPSLP